MARFKQDTEEMAYRIYISDILKSSAKSLGIETSERYYDLIKEEPKEKQSYEEIASEVIKNAGLVVI